MKKQLGIAAMGLAGLAAGAGAGLVLTSGGGDASAQTATTTPDTTAPSGSSATPPSGDAKPDKGQWLADALAPLVKDGTITQAQADAVTAAIEAARPAPGAGHDHGGPGRGGPGRGFGLDAAATAIGISADELRTALEGGQTIAQVAASKGVELSKVTDAMLAAATERVQAAVTDGKMTQAEADAEIAEAKGRIDQIVNGTFPGHPDRDQAPPTTEQTS